MHDQLRTTSGQNPSGRSRFLPLGQWLFLLVFVFMLGPLCVSNLWGYLQSRRALTEAAFRNIRNVASLEASQTLEYVRNMRSAFTSALQGDRHLADAMGNLLAAQDKEVRQAAGQAIWKHLEAKAAGVRSLEEIQVFSQTGALLLSTLGDRVPHVDLASSPCLQKGKTAPEIAGFSYESGKPNLWLAAPIGNGRGGTLGLVCARFSFDPHRRLVLAHKERTTQATLYLLNDRGQIVCGSFEDAHHAPYGRRFRPGGRELPSLDEPWEGRYLLESGAEAMIAYTPIPGLGWGVAVEVPVVLALADLERLKWQAVGATGALVLVVIAAVFWSWQKVVRPLQSLSRTAESMALGPTGETVVPGGSREIAELATAFNRMSLALWDSRQTLERRITERTRELQESREFAELLLNSIDHRVVVVDRSYRIVKVNAAVVRMYGRDFVGTHCYEAFEGRAEVCDGCPASRTFETGHPASDERSQRTDKGWEAIHVEAYPVCAADGGVESVIEIGRVITAEKQLQTQMMHQEKMAAFGLLAAGIAHEIGNPLAAIESQLQIAQDQPDRPDETLTIVRKEVGRISRLLRELVDFARRKRDALVLVSANQVVEDVARLLSHDPRAQTVTIVRRLAPNLPGIRTKEDYLFQVLINLGLNALDAMPEEGTLRFETGTDDGEIVVRVSDTGCGIPPSIRQHLFDPFFTTKAPGRGTGLGLFVSRGIVGGMGGRLELERTGPGGTVFVVRLPVKNGGWNGAT